MKRPIIFVITMIALISANLSSRCFAQDESSLPNAPQEEPAEALDSAKIVYHYEIDFFYQASNESWWTGLAVLNGQNFTTNNILVQCYDPAGALVGSGVFTLTAKRAMRVGTLQDLITNGTLPERGSIVVLGEQYFEATEIVGNSSGGFGMIQQAANAS